MNTHNIIVLFLALSMSGKAQLFTAKKGETLISFHSEAPIENIDASNTIATIVYQGSSNDLQISMNIQNFKFKNSLMEEHFNENYLESEKYPKCTFKGKINEVFDTTQPGETPVTITGTLNLHGVSKPVSIPGKVVVANGLLVFSSQFPIKLADYNIQVPSMYVKNIAEVVDVTFKSTLEPFKQK